MLYCCDLRIIICSLVKVIKACDHKILWYFISKLCCHRTHPGSNVIICTYECSRKRILFVMPFFNVSYTCSKIKVAKHIHIICKRNIIICHGFFKCLKPHFIFVMKIRSPCKNKASAVMLIIQMIKYFPE